MKTIITALTLLGASLAGSYNFMQQGNFLFATIILFCGIGLCLSILGFMLWDRLTAVYVLDPDEEELDEFMDRVYKEQNTLMFKGYKEHTDLPDNTIISLIREEEYHCQWN